MISTHTLRKEGDEADLGEADLSKAFQPTPSARRVTFRPVEPFHIPVISTHTLRKEGDHA